MTINKLLDLNGRTALITGAAGGLGGEFSKTLAELGANLIITDRDIEALEVLKKDLSEKYKIKIITIECDLETAEGRTNLVNEIERSIASLEILVNNAAFVGSSQLSGWSVPFESQSLSTFRRATEVNLSAVFDLCQKLAPLLRLGKAPTIINVASIYGFVAPKWSLYEGTSMGNPAAYASSKAGVIQLTKWLASALAPTIRVNCISPGGIFSGQPQIFVDRYSQHTPLARMAKFSDFAGAIAYLATDLSLYVTGHNLIVDGGWSIW